MDGTIHMLSVDCMYTNSHDIAWVFLTSFVMAIACIKHVGCPYVCMKEMDVYKLCAPFHMSLFFFFFFF